MDWAAIALISGTIGSAIGALLRFFLESRRNAATIEAERRKEDRETTDSIIAHQQAEIVRISAERDKLMAIVLANVATMNESAEVLEQKSTGSRS